MGEDEKYIAFSQQISVCIFLSRYVQKCGYISLCYMHTNDPIRSWTKITIGLGSKNDISISKITKDKFFSEAYEDTAERIFF